MTEYMKAGRFDGGSIQPDMDLSSGILAGQIYFCTASK